MRRQRRGSLKMLYGGILVILLSVLISLLHLVLWMVVNKNKLFQIFASMHAHSMGNPQLMLGHDWNNEVSVVDN
jgi:hypothetical protein